MAALAYKNFGISATFAARKTSLIRVRNPETQKPKSMSTLRVAINGLGRIGRITLRQLMDRDGIEVVAVNDLVDNAILAHLFKYDTAHGVFAGEVSHDDENLIVSGTAIKALSEPDPANLPWGDLGVDVVIESSGRFTSQEDAGKHITAGADKVIISAPAKGGIKTIVLGVNDDELTADDTIVSNASCTTNCLAPMVKVLDDNWGFEEGFMTTVHAFTSDQRIQDAPHKDLRRARSASQNIIPTSTGAAKAVGLVIPQVAGKLTGIAMRVPVIDGSITDLTCTLKNTPTAEEINAAMKAASETYLKGIMQYTEDPIVSGDIISNPYSNIFDSLLTSVNGGLVKVVGWYDNEYGYSARVVDLVAKMVTFKVPA
jgi:glyceraldehyde 3-phosphate dehydrogenase